MLSVLKESVDVKALEGLVLKLAARIKSPKPWPEQPVVYDMAGFRVWVGVTPEKGFRRVAVTHPQDRSWTLVLVDANPEKVGAAERKVMVYLSVAAPDQPWRIRRCVGQVRLGGVRPILVWFNQDRTAPRGDRAAAVSAGASARRACHGAPSCRPGV